MLPNHAPLVVAERFKMLEALFPGRIDLGLGRAPGTDGATAHALRSRLDRREGDDFLERLSELVLWETRDFPAGHPYNNVVAMPDDTPLPPIWLLGSSDYSSELAAQVGMGFAFAHHFASYDAIAAMTNYRSHFKPSGWRADARTAFSPSRRLPPKPMRKPKSSPPRWTSTACAATAANICRCRASRKRWPIITRTPSAPRSMRNRSRLFVGSPATIMAKLQPMITASQPDELMIITAVYDHDARKKSYSLLADAFGLGKKVAAVKEPSLRESRLCANVSPVGPHSAVSPRSVLQASQRPLRRAAAEETRPVFSASGPNADLYGAATEYPSPTP